MITVPAGTAPGPWAYERAPVEGAGWAILDAEGQRVAIALREVDARAIVKLRSYSRTASRPRWSEEEQREFLRRFEAGAQPEQIARALGRTVSSVRERMSATRRARRGTVKGRAPHGFETLSAVARRAGYSRATVRAICERAGVEMEVVYCDLGRRRFVHLEQALAAVRAHMRRAA